MFKKIKGKNKQRKWKIRKQYKLSNVWGACIFIIRFNNIYNCAGKYNTLFKQIRKFFRLSRRSYPKNTFLPFRHHLCTFFKLFVQIQIGEFIGIFGLIILNFEHSTLRVPIKPKQFSNFCFHPLGIFE